MLGPAAANAWLLESLAALLDTGCRWSEAAAASACTGTRSVTEWSSCAKQTGRHPDDPAERMELWLAVKAQQALGARAPAEPSTPSEPEVVGAT